MKTIYLSVPIKLDWKIVNEAVEILSKDNVIKYWKRGNPYNQTMFDACDSIIIFTETCKQFNGNLTDLSPGVLKELRKSTNKKKYLAYKTTLNELKFYDLKINEDRFRGIMGSSMNIFKNTPTNNFPKIGSKIKIIKGVSGCIGANKRVGIVTDAKHNDGLSIKDEGFNVLMTNGRVWRVNGKYEYIDDYYIECETKEEVIHVKDYYKKTYHDAFPKYTCISIKDPNLSFRKDVISLDEIISYKQWQTLFMNKPKPMVTQAKYVDESYKYDQFIPNINFREINKDVILSMTTVLMDAYPTVQNKLTKFHNKHTPILIDVKKIKI